MVRMIIGGLIGGIVLFGWGCVSWLVLDVHKSTLRRLPNEEAVTASLRQHISESGLYWFPMLPPQGTPQEVEQWFQRHREGSTGMLLYRAEGVEAVTGGMLLNGLGLHLAGALMVSWVVWLARASANTAIKRMGVAMLLGLFVAATTDLTMWNWMRYPTDYSMVNAAGHVVGMLLTGIPIALIVGSREA